MTTERQIDNFNVALIAGIGLLQGCAIAALVKLPGDAWIAAHPWTIRLLWSAAIFMPATAQWLIAYRRRAFFWLMLAGVAALIGVATWQSAALLAPGHIDGSGVDQWLPPIGFLTWLALMSLAEFTATTSRRAIDYPVLYGLTMRNILLPAGAGLFTLLVWGLMAIWSGLFKLLGFTAIAEFLLNHWLLFPLFGLAFGLSSAVLIGRPNLIDGARRVLGAISTALAPLAALIVVAFVIGLSIAGPQPLWKTGYATYLMLLLAAAFSLFLNATHDDGKNLLCLPKPLLVLMRLAAALMPVLVGISVYSLGLRIAQYGWTVDRIFGALALALASLTALGYLAASIRPRAALPSLARVNLVALIGALLIGLAVSTGLLSPTQITVRDQLARIRDGRAEFAKIDWTMFAVQLGQPGRDALAALANDQTVTENLRLGADRAIKMPPAQAYSLNRQILSELSPPSDYRLLPGGEPADKALIEAIRKDAASGVASGRACLKDCYVLPIDLDGDGVGEMVVMRDYAPTPVFRKTEAGWARIGTLNNVDRRPQFFGGLIEKLRAGKARAVVPAYRDIDVDGQLLQFTADNPRP